jgi:membrane protein
MAKPQPNPTRSTERLSEAPERSRTRGRYASRPTEIPARGWKDVLLRVKDEIGKDNLSLVAGGVAFYLFLAIFPAIAATVMIYGAFADPHTVEQQIAGVRGFMPQEAWAILQEQLTKVAQTSGGALSFGAAFSILFALWSTTKGTNALMTAMNIAYEEQETRGFFKTNFTALALSAAIVLFVVFAIAVVVVAPAVLRILPLGPVADILVRVLRWVMMAVVVVGVLGLIYKFAPSRRRAKAPWVTPGAIAAAVLWLVGSVLFSLYVANFGSYNKTFGALGAVVALLMWFWLSAYVICLGAELNAELERQTARDSGVGRERPMGQREARVADEAVAPR